MTIQPDKPTQAIKPHFMIELWHGIHGNVIFQDVCDRPYQELSEWFDYKVIINGKAATVYCFFSDYDISNVDCVVAATTFVTGAGTRFDIDLDRCVTTKSKPENKLNPRQ